MERRTFLRRAAALTAATTGLAGCGSPGDETATGDDLVGDGTDTESDLDVTDTESDMGTDTESDMGTDTESDMGTETDSEFIDIEVMDGETPDNVQVSNTEIQRSGGDAVVTGTVENTGDQTIDEVEVAVTLLDDNDELVGQFFHSTQDAEVESLDAGATWDFSVSFPEEDLEDAARYRIDVDTDINQTVDWDIGIGTETDTPTG